MLVKPLLFLDVDGVLNYPAYPYKEYLLQIDPAGFPKNAFTKSFSSDDVRDFTVRFHTYFPAWLLELAEAFELVWATTWEHQANTYLSPLLGLGTLAVVEFDQPSEEHVQRDCLAEWKWENIARFAGDRPFVFVDDHAGRLAAEYPLKSGTSRAALAPALALLREDVDALLAFARSLKEL